MTFYYGFDYFTPEFSHTILAPIQARKLKSTFLIFIQNHKRPNSSRLATQCLANPQMLAKINLIHY